MTLTSFPFLFTPISWFWYLSLAMMDLQEVQQFILLDQ